jgi:nitrogenase delta subunit
MNQQEQMEQLFGYVQERCLWQFSSRGRDRQENIDGVIATATDMLHGKDLSKHTPMQKMFYADAKLMVTDFRERFPWINELEPTKITELMAALKAELVDHTITKSLNHELNHTLY